MKGMKYILIVLGIVVGIMGTAIVFLLNKDKSAETSESSAVTATPTATVPQEEKKQGWQQVAVFAGTDDQDTSSFIINEAATKWRVTYTLTGTDYLPSFSVDIHDKATGTEVKYGTGENGLSQLLAREGTHQALIEDVKAGEYYLHILSANVPNWDIVVEELY